MKLQRRTNPGHGLRMSPPHLDLHRGSGVELGKPEEEVDDIGAAVRALRRTELFREAGIEERIRRDAERFPVKTASFDAFVGFNPVLDFIGFNVGSSASVGFLSASLNVLLQDAAFSGG